MVAFLRVLGSFEVEPDTYALLPINLSLESDNF